MAAFPQDDSSADDEGLHSDWSNLDFYDALGWSQSILAQPGDEGLGDRLATCTVVDAVTDDGVRRLDTNFQTSNGDSTVEIAGMRDTMRPEDLLLSDQTTSQSNTFQLDSFIDELCFYQDAPLAITRQQVVDEIVEGIASRLSMSRSTPKASYAFVNPPSVLRNVRSKFGSTLSIANQHAVDQIVDGVASKLSASKSTPKASAVYIPAPVKSINTDTDTDAGRSDCSWDEQDRLEKFYAIAETKLQALKEQSAEHKFVLTRYLDRRRRRVIHALAHLRRLNHMAIDDRKDGRILISTASIDDTFDFNPRKCWNETSTSLLIDPMTVVMRIPNSISRQQVDIKIHRTGFGFPISWSYDRLDGPYYEYSARFGTAGDAATAWDRLQASRTFDSTLADVKVTYRTWHKPPPREKGLNKKHGPDQGLQSRRRLCGEATGQKCLGEDRPGDTPQNANLSISNTDIFVFIPTVRNSNNYVQYPADSGATSLASPDEDSSGYSSSSSLSSSKRSFSEYFDDWSEFGYLGPNEDGTLEHSENPSNTKRQCSGPRRKKRQPKRSNGYPCTYQQCDKVFDYDGERVKHEKVHKPREERPHGCQYCHMRFMDQKDVRRHEKTHSRD